MNAQVSFLDGELSLIHIPLDLYYAFFQPILQILLPQAQSLSKDEDDPDQAPPEGLTVDYTHSFLNLSVTPVECSIVCHTHWTKNIFEPALRAAQLPQEALGLVSIAKEAYIALCVMSGGLDAGSRVVDISSPLALAGIPLFFITTYYSDFILVPSKDRQNVIQALLERGFEFSELESSFVSPGSLSHPQAQNQHRRGSGGMGASITSSTSATSATSAGGWGNNLNSSIASLASLQLEMDPPSNQAELQDRTFYLLRKRNVVPYIVPGLTLTHCSGNSVIPGSGGGAGMGSGGRGAGLGGNGGNGGSGGGGRSMSGGGGGQGHSRGPQRRGTRHQRDSWIDTVDTRLYTCLVAALALPPRFLSITLAAPDPPSVLLDKRLLPLFGNSLVGDVAGDLVPIFLDLVTLPFEATGIVSGVAGKLVAEMNKAELPDLSYLSTSKAGAVILSSENAESALQILEPILGGEAT